MHTSVLLEETIKYLNLKDDSTIVDATLGYGGHSSEILKRIKRGRLFCFDQDKDAISYSEERLSSIGNNYQIIKSNFVHMKEKLEEAGISKVDGVLFDLGVSSPQLDQKERGFSYHQDATLDMRMDQDGSLSAFDVVNTYDKKELERIFREYGESKFASNIAKKIVEYRVEKQVESTLELVEIIKTAVPMKFRVQKHPAKQIFQAIRIEVNHELDVIEPAIMDSLGMLNIGGRVAVITFHSLEDKLVKKIFKKITEIDPKLKGMPNISEELLPDYQLVVNKILPKKEEIERNKRARSATLRVIERIK